MGETRIWVASSADGSVGSWTNHLAADAGDKTVSASFEPAAVDRAGNVYVAYAETAHPYPDFSGAAVKYVTAGPDAAQWSKPRKAGRSCSDGLEKAPGAVRAVPDSSSSAETGHPSFT